MKKVMIGCVVVCLAGAGCARPQAVRKTSPPQVTAAKETAPPQGGATRGADLSAVPLPYAPLEAAEGSKGTPEEFRKAPRRYTLVMGGADARELLLSLARENDFNLILSPDVSGAVTLDVKEFTAAEVIAEVCGLIGCRTEFSGRTVRILAEKRVTRIFPLDYLLTSRIGSGSLTASTSTGSSSASSTGSTGTATGGGGGGGESQSSNTISTEEKFDFWSGLVEETQSMLSGGEAKAMLNRASGTLVVTDYPANLDRVAEYLRVLEGRVKSAVMIEAKILEISLDDTTQYGINWSAIPAMSGIGLSGTLTGDAVARQTLPSGSTAFQIGVAGGRFDAFLDALSKQVQINVLSAPKVSTLNNQKAIIRIGRQDVFFRAVITPATTTSAPIVTFTPDTITEGIILSVTPQIGRDGRVMLSIHPSITEKVGEAKAPDGNTAPIVDVRETNTVISVSDGQTVFIGGLMQEKTQETVSGVPFLSDIPYLGAMFRSNVQTKKKTELVILITPRVARADELAEIGARERERATNLQHGFHVGGKPWVYGTEGERKALQPWE